MYINFKKMGFFSKFFGTIFTIILVIGILCLTIMSVATNFTKESFYKRMINNIDTTYIEVSGEKVSLKEAIIDKFEEENIDRATAEKLLEDKDIKNLISSLAADVAQYLVMQEQVPKIDIDDVNTIIDKLDLRKDFDRNNLNINEIVDNANETLKNELTTEKIDYNIQKIFKPNYSIILPVSIIVSFLLLMLITKHYIHAFSFMGVALIIDGIIMFLIYFAVKAAINDNIVFDLVLRRPTIIYISVFLMLGIAMLITKSKLKKNLIIINN